MLHIECTRKLLVHRYTNDHHPFPTGNQHLESFSIRLRKWSMIQWEIRLFRVHFWSSTDCEFEKLGVTSYSSKIGFLLNAKRETLNQPNKFKTLRSRNIPKINEQTGCQSYIMAHSYPIVRRRFVSRGALWTVGSVHGFLLWFKGKK